MITKKDVAATFCRAYGAVLVCEAVFNLPTTLVYLSNQLSGMRLLVISQLLTPCFGIGLLVLASGIAAEMTGELEPSQYRPVESPADLKPVGRAIFGLLLVLFGSGRLVWNLIAFINGGVGPGSSNLLATLLTAAVMLLVTSVGFYLAFSAGISARLRRSR